MTKKRSREEMVFEVLKMAREPGAAVSSITQNVSLPWNSWVQMSQDLIERGLLMIARGQSRYSTKDTHYVTTDKGLEWVRMREKMQEI